MATLLERCVSAGLLLVCAFLLADVCSANRSDEGVQDLCSKIDLSRSRCVAMAEDRSHTRVKILNGRRLILRGLQLRDEMGCVGEQGVCEGCTVMEVATLTGGGCDGGTTALQRKFMSQVFRLLASRFQMGEQYEFLAFSISVA